MNCIYLKQVIKKLFFLKITIDKFSHKKNKNNLKNDYLRIIKKKKIVYFSL